MRIIDKEHIIDCLSQITNSKKLIKIQIQSYKLLFEFNKDNMIRKAVFILIELVISWFIYISDSTSVILEKISNIYIDVSLALLACVITAYAIFQAILSDDLLKALLNYNNDNNSDSNINGHNSDENSNNNNYSNVENENDFNMINIYFLKIMTIQLYMVILNIFMYVISNITLNKFVISVSLYKIFKFFVLLVYFYVNTEAIYELRSFILNVFKIFNLYTLSRVKNISNE